MSKIKNYLIKCIHLKYQNTLFSKKIILAREKELSRIYNLRKKFQDIQLQEKFKNNVFYTDFFFKKLIYKNINNKNLKIIADLYKKFSFSLKLRNTYTKNLKKNSVIEANIDSYIIFGYLVSKLKKLNELQKLNCLLKINDICLIKLSKNKSVKYIDILKKNIDFENKIKKKYAKKFFLNLS